jgi:predicted nucleic acid-binding protein
MNVADTSYMVEAILRNAQLLEGESLAAPELTLYETVNVIWKHETLIRDIRDATRYLDALETLIQTKTITLVKPDGKLIRDAYSLSVRHGAPFYDTVFVALALRLQSELKTFDKEQMKMYLEEKRRMDSPKNVF